LMSPSVPKLKDVTRLRLKLTPSFFACKNHAFLPN
jgi:hypothetical protein